jgi:SRSO17 transposase
MLDQITTDPDTGPDSAGPDSAGPDSAGPDSAGPDSAEPDTEHWGLPERPVVADAGYGEVTEFRLALTERGLPYVLAVKATTSAYPAEAVPYAPAYTGRGRPPVPRYHDDPTNLAALVLTAGRSALRRITWRHGTRGNSRNPTAAMKSRFLTLRIRPANRDIPRGSDGALPECWLIAEWPPGKPEPTDYWLSTMPMRLIRPPRRNTSRLQRRSWTQMSRVVAGSRCA